MEDREQYLTKLLGFKNPDELQKWMNEPERPTGNMGAPEAYYQDAQRVADEADKNYQSRK